MSFKVEEFVSNLKKAIKHVNLLVDDDDDDDDDYSSTNAMMRTCSRYRCNMSSQLIYIFIYIYIHHIYI